MAYETVQIHIEKGVAHLFMCRPEKANAMGEAFWREFPQAIDELDADPAVRAIVISGQGKHFTAGIDLTMMHSLMPDPKQDAGRVREKLRRTILRMQDCFTSLDRCRKPSIAAVHGGCLGAGVDLVTACDMRLAAKGSYFTVQEINIGMVADVGTLQRIGHLLPHGIVRELAYTGRRFEVEEARHFGFVNGIGADRDDVIAKALDMAAIVARKSPLAISGIKQVLNHARDHSIADGLDYVAAWNSGVLISEDLMKGAQAALQRKEADFDDLLE
ncbi:enoyl-CoA hydratase [Iodidimonas muriae]|uniref:Enoyl-CoA hydratase n=1 Tax=Iodidimonas muriae TaxID=261467 RepID=A0ABQ2LDQ8_9PROT|nr:crotonase/enoyl-CoA hydratase family protein [Iodidimonas muriae]GER08202.1 enoyl-CoA hydratase [Kordiimonadales bacterium JCM 17843]GGO12403.1 enoyl-CoA hydratase [Iodidimonas muriae]